MKKSFYENIPIYDLCGLAFLGGQTESPIHNIKVSAAQQKVNFKRIGFSMLK